MDRPTSAPLTRPEDLALRCAWTDARTASPSDLPFSFRYGDTVVPGLPDAWRPVVTTRRLDANLVETLYEATDPATGLVLRVEWLTYEDFPVVEWVVWLTNTGEAPTPLISDLQALDGAFSGAAPVLEHCNGDFCSAEGYAPQETPLPEGAALTCAPTGGRPCDGAFPYFRVQCAGHGLTLAVGWPAQWSATFTGLPDGFAVRAGQELTHLRLLPGESLRTPRMALMFWSGETPRAVNLWRRWYLTHLLPRTEGQPLQPLLALAGTDPGNEFTAATEENQLRYQDKFHRLGFDYDVWWIDAGWYPCPNPEGERLWWLTGTWFPDPDRFPRGFRPVSAQAATHGARLLMWFEPERVTAGSWLSREHPDWLLRVEGEQQNALLNLGLPACRQWLTDHVCAFLRDNGVGIYRQDFNFPPLAYWRDNDAADRQGMNENLHVQGYLRYWDDLLARNPGLWIDSCSSGGRRNDLETMRRSVPLHYTDHGYGDHPVKLAFHHTLFAWIPYFKECTLSWDQLPEGADTRFDPQVDSFSFHCALAAMLFVTIDIRRDDYDVDLLRRLVALWRRAAPFFLYGDYWPCTPFSPAPDRWVAWQFDLPEQSEGLVQGIRLAACPQESLTVTLQALDPEAVYLFDNPETGEQFRRSGADLMGEGLTLSLPPRSGALLFYRRLEATPEL